MAIPQALTLFPGLPLYKYFPLFMFQISSRFPPPQTSPSLPLFFLPVFLGWCDLLSLREYGRSATVQVLSLNFKRPCDCSSCTGHAPTSTWPSSGQPTEDEATWRKASSLRCACRGPRHEQPILTWARRTAQLSPAQGTNPQKHELNKTVVV